MLVLRNLTPSTTPRIIWSNKSLHIEYHLISVKFQVNIMINKLTASDLMSSFYSFFTGLYSFPHGGYPVLGRIYNTQYHDRYLADRVHIWCTFNHKCTKYCHALWMLKHHVWLHIGCTPQLPIGGNWPTFVFSYDVYLVVQSCKRSMVFSEINWVKWFPYWSQCYI